MKNEIYKAIDEITEYIEDLENILKSCIEECLGWKRGEDFYLHIEDVDTIELTVRRSSGEDEYILNSVEFARFLKYGEEGLD